MIESIEVLGYQSHLETIVDLSPGVNILIGGSDEGKSAFNRLLRWVCRNKPIGDDFRNWDLKVNDVVEGTIAFTDGSWITRRKGKGVNEYLVSGIKDPLKALHTDVPQEVFDVSKMNDINFQRQASWFLLDEKPGPVAKQFNELAELGVMDSALTIANARVRETKARVTFTEEQVKGWQAKVKEIDKWLVPASSHLVSIDTEEQVLRTMIVKEERVITILENLDKIWDRLDKLEPVHSAEKELEVATELNETYKELCERRRKLRKLAESIGTARSQLKQYTAMHQIERAIFDALCVKAESSALYEKKKVLKGKVDNLKRVQDELKDTKDFVKKTEEIVQSMLKKLGVCPTCNRRI